MEIIRGGIIKLPMIITLLIGLKSGLAYTVAITVLRKLLVLETIRYCST